MIQNLMAMDTVQLHRQERQRKSNQQNAKFLRLQMKQKEEFEDFKKREKREHKDVFEHLMAQESPEHTQKVQQLNSRNLTEQKLYQT